MAWSKGAASGMEQKNEFHQKGCSMGFLRSRIQKENTLLWLSLPTGILTAEAILP
jgi:hypothetical protein